jgi:hypothetical protein
MVFFPVLDPLGSWPPSKAVPAVLHLKAEPEAPLSGFADGIFTVSSSRHVILLGWESHGRNGARPIG